MAGATQTCTIAKRTRNRIMRDHVTTFKASRPRAPFNSTASLILLRHQKDQSALATPVLGDRELDQYGSNFKEAIASRIFTKRYTGQRFVDKPLDQTVDDHPDVMAKQHSQPPSRARNVHPTVGHLRPSAKPQAADPPPPPPARPAAEDRKVSTVHSGTRNERKRLEPASRRETERFQREGSVTDDNFNILLSNAATSTMVLDDLGKNFLGLGISEAANKPARR